MMAGLSGVSRAWSAMYMRTLGRELGGAFLAVAGQALARLRAGEAHELQRQRGVERRSGAAQPVVERLLGETDGAGRAIGQLAGDLDRLGVELGVLRGQRDHPDALG